MKTQGVYALIGMPYSGSTILSFLLGSHSKVYNGADLHHLNPERRGQCSLHKNDCPVWTAEALQRAYSAFSNVNDWYDVIADITGRPFVCDASKQLSFYEHALPGCERPLFLILLKKHPMRSAASDIYNRLFAKQLKISALEEIHSYLASNFDEATAFIDKRLNQFVQHYRSREELVSVLESQQKVKGKADVRYEEVVENPSAVLERLLASFDLSMETGQLDYTAFEHHPITGNMGPLWKTRQAGKITKGNNKDFRKGYYMRESSAIVMDNKYTEIFNEKQIAQIETLPSYRELLDILDYEPMR